MEVALHETGGYDYFSIPQLHAGEIRRFAEGVRYRTEQRRSRQGSTRSENIASRKQELEKGHRAERQRLLDEISNTGG